MVFKIRTSKKTMSIFEETKNKLSRTDFCTSLAKCIAALPDPDVPVEEKNMLLKKVVKNIIFNQH